MIEKTEPTAADLAEADPFPTKSRAFIPVVIAIAICIPAVVFQATSTTIESHPLSALTFGLAIVGAAFLLSWAAEVAELDISRGLAIAVLALIAVLPEYAVDFVFAHTGGQDFAQYGESCKAPGASESSCSLALANMTGGNRMLIGIGWSLVVLVALAAWKKRGVKKTSVELPRGHSVEIAFLCIASLYGLTLPLRSTIEIWDSVILVAIFVAYMIRVSKAHAEEPELVGPAAWIGKFPVQKRRTAVILLFLFSGIVILLCAHPFAESLVQTGEDAGINTFFLVQWVAPLATETPELLVACLFAWRLRASNGLSTLVSSKVNQWTLLVGTLPIAFSLGANGLHGLPIDAHQQSELLLTAAQTVFALSILINLSLSKWEAIGLMSLFFAQFFLSAIPEIFEGFGHPINGVRFESDVRHVLSAIYLTAAVVLLFRQRKQFFRVMKDGLVTPLSQLD